MEIKIFPEPRSLNILDEETESYQNKTHKSRSFYDEAQKYLPGGITRALHFFEPYPIYVERGEGCYVFDVEGSSRIDFLIMLLL